LKIGRLAKLCGLSERTIRYYECLGIIKPMRTQGGTRLYRDSEVEVARIVQRMRDLDIPVEEIRKIATKRQRFCGGAHCA
jgi:DNA-binding transcriptional MerR regulator